MKTICILIVLVFVANVAQAQDKAAKPQQQTQQQSKKKVAYCSKFCGGW